MTGYIILGVYLLGIILTIALPFYNKEAYKTVKKLKRRHEWETEKIIIPLIWFGYIPIKLLSIFFNRLGKKLDDQWQKREKLEKIITGENKHD